MVSKGLSLSLSTFAWLIYLVGGNNHIGTFAAFVAAMEFCAWLTYGVCRNY